MKIVVVGGNGRIGSKLVSMLTRDGLEVVAASRRSGIDVVSGEGLAEALTGALVVIDVTDSPSFEDVAVINFFKASTHNLITRAAAAGVAHYIVLSVVGTGRLLQSGYFREDGAGKVGPRIVPSLHDHSDNPILRVLGSHRRRRDVWQRRPSAASAHPAHCG